MFNVNKQLTCRLKASKKQYKTMIEKKTTNKTTFETISKALERFSKYFTVQENDINQYARICFTDDYKKDNYKIMKDFAIYYDRRDSYKISIADSTLIDCKVFKENHEKSEKTKALEFSVKSEDIVNVVYEILAQKLMQTDKVKEITFTIKAKAKSTSANKKSKAKAK